MYYGQVWVVAKPCSSPCYIPHTSMFQDSSSSLNDIHPHMYKNMVHYLHLYIHISSIVLQKRSRFFIWPHYEKTSRTLTLHGWWNNSNFEVQNAFIRQRIVVRVSDVEGHHHSSNPSPLLLGLEDHVNYVSCTKQHQFEQYLSNDYLHIWWTIIAMSTE